ncbi:MAG: alpha/beta hydrolase [Firmicutes bacterium]|nr:alpha/beta hydrolase [Bacillota bacterium]
MIIPSHFVINGVPALLYGQDCGRVFLHVHGQFGCKEEASRLVEIICPRGYQVLSVDLPGHGERISRPDCFVPWEAVPELRKLFAYARKRWSRISLYAVSIGAYFSLLAFRNVRIEKSMFVSPILDMDKLIRDRMQLENITREQLREAGEIPISSGEPLSWKYLQYAEENRITEWSSPTAILYAGGDTLTDRQTVNRFMEKFPCSLTVMEDGEHWFHTPEQLGVLENWIKNETEHKDGE